MQTYRRIVLQRYRPTGEHSRAPRRRRLSHSHSSNRTITSHTSHTNPRGSLYQTDHQVPPNTIFCCRDRGCGCKPHYYQEDDNGKTERRREYRAEDDQAECLVDEMLTDMFRFGSKVSPVGFCSFLFIMTTYIV